MNWNQIRASANFEHKSASECAQSHRAREQAIQKCRDLSQAFHCYGERTWEWFIVIHAWGGYSYRAIDHTLTNTPTLGVSFGFKLRATVGVGARCRVDSLL